LSDDSQDFCHYYYVEQDYTKPIQRLKNNRKLALACPEQGRRIGFVFTDLQNCRIAIFTCHKRAYVNFSHAWIGFVLHKKVNLSNILYICRAHKFWFCRTLSSFLANSKKSIIFHKSLLLWGLGKFRWFGASDVLLTSVLSLPLSIFWFYYPQYSIRSTTHAIRYPRNEAILYPKPAKKQAKSFRVWPALLQLSGKKQWALSNELGSVITMDDKR
jgi:hypothetical protein